MIYDVSRLAHKMSWHLILSPFPMVNLEPCVGNGSILRWKDSESLSHCLKEGALTGKSLLDIRWAREELLFC